MTDDSSAKAGKTTSFDIPSLLRLPLVYWKQSAAVIVVILVVAGGYALFTVYQKGQIEKAENALGTLVATSKGADLVTALTAMATTAPAGARDAVNLELAKAALAAGDFDKAAAAWEAVSAKAPVAMRVIARLGQAAALSKAGKDTQAVTVLEQLKADAPKAFAMTIDRQLAITAEAAGQWQKALDAYGRMKADGSLQNPGYIDARIAALKAKTDAPATPNTNS